MSYYTMFYTKPVGTFVLSVCRTLSCALNGAERVTEEICGDAGHQAGRDRSRRGTFTLLEVECLGACDRAPVVMVNDAWHECLKPEDVPTLLDDLRDARRGGADRLPSRRGERSQSSRLQAGAAAWTSDAWNRCSPNTSASRTRFTLDFYLQHEGYEGLKKALAHDARPGHRARQGVGPARPRRRRVSRPA